MKFCAPCITCHIICMTCHISWTTIYCLTSGHFLHTPWCTLPRTRLSMYISLYTLPSKYFVTLIAQYTLHFLLRSITKQVRSWNWLTMLRKCIANATSLSHNGDQIAQIYLSVTGYALPNMPWTSGLATFKCIVNCTSWFPFLMLIEFASQLCIMYGPNCFQWNPKM